jgi:NAD(P)-dependent dehydrogenase (short-subunit alcohol dehydrogenase family)
MSVLSGRRALVTGGSRGIGAAIVRRLAADGAMVGFTYAASGGSADKLRAEVSAHGGTVVAMTKGQWLRSFPTESGSRKSGTRVPRGSIIERTATMAPGCHRPANLGETAEATEPVIAAVAATFAVSKQAAAIRLTGERLLGASRGDGGHARGRQTSGRG